MCSIRKLWYSEFVIFVTVTAQALLLNTNFIVNSEEILYNITNKKFLKQIIIILNYTQQFSHYWYNMQLARV